MFKKLRHFGDRVVVPTTDALRRHGSDALADNFSNIEQSGLLDPGDLSHIQAMRLKYCAGIGRTTATGITSNDAREAGKASAASARASVEAIQAVNRANRAFWDAHVAQYGASITR